MTQENARRNVSEQETAAVSEKAIEGAGKSATERVAELDAETDDLLDEIDEVLEANAEEFVKSYIQKGGQ